MNTHDIVYGDGTEDTPEATPAATPADAASTIASSIPAAESSRLDSMLAALPDRPMRKDSYKPNRSA